jgi:hypothetical protein
LRRHLGLNLGHILLCRRKVHLGHLVHRLLRLRHLGHFLGRHHGLLTLRHVSRVVTGTAVATGRASSRRTTVASWWGHARVSSLVLIEVHGLNRSLRHVLRYSIDSTETWRHGDTLTDAVSINCAQHLRTGLVIDVSLVGELS